MALTPMELSHGDIPNTDITLPSGTTDVTIVGGKYYAKNGVVYFNIVYQCADTDNHEVSNVFPRGDFGGGSYIYFYPVARKNTGANFASGELRINTYGSARFSAAQANVGIAVSGSYPMA